MADTSDATTVGRLRPNSLVSVLSYPAGVRDATADDVETILDLIRSLADYEREPESAVATTDDIHAALFGPDAVASCLIAERDGQAVGIALWFRTFSTWTGRPGMHLEDLFVRPEHRGYGLGKALFVALARICEANNWPRMEWAVLDWNTPSIDFYDSLDARPQSEWITYRLTGEPLLSLADT